MCDPAIGDGGNGAVFVVGDGFEEVACGGFVGCDSEVNLGVRVCENGGEVDLGKTKGVGHGGTLKRQSGKHFK